MAAFRRRDSARALRAAFDGVAPEFEYRIPLAFFPQGRPQASTSELSKLSKRPSELKLGVGGDRPASRAARP